MTLPQVLGSEVRFGDSANRREADDRRCKGQRSGQVGVAAMGRTLDVSEAGYCLDHGCSGTSALGSV